MATSMAAARLHPAPSLAHTLFADTRHLTFYGQRAAAAPRRAVFRPSAFKLAHPAACTSSSGQRARVLRHIETVEETLRHLEQAGPLASMPSLERRCSTTTSSSSSDSSDSDSSASEEEVPRPAASRLARRLQQQQQQQESQRDQSTLQRPQQSQQPPALEQQQQAAANNIVARSAAAATANPTATVVRVCQGKKCSQQGASALLQHFAAVPGVVAQPVKCLKQCKRCPAVEMAAAFGGGGPPATYTGVSPANAAAVLAIHHQQRAQAPAAAHRQC